MPLTPRNNTGMHWVADQSFLPPAVVQREQQCSGVNGSAILL